VRQLAKTGGTGKKRADIKEEAQEGTQLSGNSRRTLLKKRGGKDETPYKIGLGRVEVGCGGGKS